MSSENHLVEQHVLQYEARLKHIDELLERAAAASAGDEELARLRREREKVADALARMRQTSLEAWAREGGPMVIWDLLAERVERLVERLEK